MKRAASVELILVCLTGVLCYLAGFSWPDSLPVGTAVISLAMVFLGQTLLRDLWLLRQERRESRPENNLARPVFCIETAIGISAVVVGCCLLFVSVPATVSLGKTGSSIAIVSTMLLCFLLRDYVFQWRPWRVFKEPDHVNIMVRW